MMTDLQKEQVRQAVKESDFHRQKVLAGFILINQSVAKDLMDISELFERLAQVSDGEASAIKALNDGMEEMFYLEDKICQTFKEMFGVDLLELLQKQEPPMIP
ncbi:MAG: hypothetical protein COA78_36430 [Blastopirellula sp.]|nr:MAG: hypothetical protein COA78_36430 [Blastopirellula sp.]